MTEKRLVVLLAAFTFFIFVIQLNMVYINVSEKYIGTAQQKQTREYAVDDSRAVIADCNFDNITNTVISYKTLVSAYDNDLQQVFNALCEKDKRNFENNINSGKIFFANLQYPVADREVYTVSQRYSDFNIAQHLIGYIDGEGNGIAGMEKVFDTQLKNGSNVRYIQAEINGYGQITGTTETQRVDNDSTTPVLLSLTIDNTVQRICEGIAKEYITDGAVVVMDTKTGQIKAMVSTPFYSANSIAKAMTMENSPLVNKALQAYEPGSVIKPLWAAVLLQNGFNADKKYTCTGFTEVNDHIFRCNNSKAHGEINMEQALVVSCNCYFIDAFISDKAFLYSQTAKAVNIGENISLTQNYLTAAGCFPVMAELDNSGQLASISFGQGKLLTSPVHIAAYMNIFANNGMYVYPQVAKGIYNADNLEEITPLYTLTEKQVISEETAQRIKYMLQSVVIDGAGGRAEPQHLYAGGKTGTAQTGRYNQDGTEILNAWFCGFYPFDNPQYTICVMLNNGGESTYTAAPVFKKICDSLYYLI